MTEDEPTIPLAEFRMTRKDAQLLVGAILVSAISTPVLLFMIFIYLSSIYDVVSR